MRYVNDEGWGNTRIRRTLYAETATPWDAVKKRIVDNGPFEC